MSPVTVVLSVEHRSYRDGLAEAISAHPALTLLAVCADADSALREIVARRPAVCLLDVVLRPMGGLKLCQHIRRALPAGCPRFILMSSDTGPSLRAQARAAGAAMVVDKHLPRHRLCELLVKTAAP